MTNADIAIVVGAMCASLFTFCLTVIFYNPRCLECIEKQRRAERDYEVSRQIARYRAAREEDDRETKEGFYW